MLDDKLSDPNSSTKLGAESSPKAWCIKKQKFPACVLLLDDQVHIVIHARGGIQLPEWQNKKASQAKAP